MHSRRNAPVVTTTHVHTICGLYADARATVKTSRPPLVVRGVRAADDTLPADEVRGATESCQVKIERNPQEFYHHVRDLGVKGSRRDGYRALRRNAAMHCGGSVPKKLHSL